MTREPFSVVELFAGIGGFALAFERCGFHVTDQVEIDPYCQAVLRKRFPESRKHPDVREVGRHNLPSPTVLCGGFPCQPHSLAGARQGSQDSRDLWPEFARLVGELQPAWVVAENVPGIRTSDGGWYFWRVLTDLAACGYDAEWDCIPASSIGANHQRDRLWIVAYPQGGDRRPGLCNSEPPEERGRELGDGGADVAYTPRDGRQQRGTESAGVEGRPSPARRGGAVPNSLRRGLEIGDGIRPGFPPEQPPTSASGSYPGVSVSNPHIFSADRIAVAREDCRHWAVEPNVGRVADGVPSRVDRLRAIGNALVPQVAEIIARRILEIELGI